jgi:hypothetical protein
MTGVTVATAVAVSVAVPVPASADNVKLTAGVALAASVVSGCLAGVVPVGLGVAPEASATLVAAPVAVLVTVLNAAPPAALVTTFVAAGWVGLAALVARGAGVFCTVATTSSGVGVGSSTAAAFTGVAVIGVAVTGVAVTGVAEDVFSAGAGVVTGGSGAVADGDGADVLVAVWAAVFVGRGVCVAGGGSTTSGEAMACGAPASSSTTTASV